MLEVRGLSVSYGGLRALDRVSLEVWPGEIVSIIGMNGAGKTSILNAISGILRPDEGEKGAWLGDRRDGQDRGAGRRAPRSVEALPLAGLEMAEVHGGEPRRPPELRGKPDCRLALTLALRCDQDEAGPPQRAE